MGDPHWPESPTVWRPAFYRKVYIILSIFAGIGLLQVLIVKAVGYDFYKECPVPSFVWLLIALGCLMTILCVKLALEFPINYLLGIIAIEALTLSVLSRDFMLLTMTWSLGVLLAAILLTLGLYLIGIFMPLQVLPGPLTMLIVTLVAIVAYIALIITRLVLRDEGLEFYITVLSLLYVMVIVVFCITLLHDRRLEHLSEEKSMLPVIVLAVLFFYKIHMIGVIVLYAVHYFKITSAIKPEELQI